jgi:glutamate-ammonia-ligase adenylyltransferase
LRDAFLYGGEPSPDPQGAYGSGDLRFDVAAMRAMRERQLRHLVTPGRVNAKFSRGGLVDVEYVTQALQIAHGRDLPELRTPNTAQAMAALVGAGVVSEENYARLSSAHLFLEQLINALRVVRGNSKDLTVPADESDEFAYLARRLGYGSDAARLSADLSHHMGWVQKLSARLLG